jgi:alanine dehydrogenase
LSNKNKILLLSLIGLFGFTFWRNYGVKAKGAVILDTENKTNEQKELVNKIKETNPKEGDELKTSFGYYKISNGNLIKTNEIWDK